MSIAKTGFSVVLSSLLLVSFTTVVSAQENEQITTVKRVRSLNNDILRVHELIRETGRKQVQARSAQGVELRSQAASVLRERAAALSKLMEENPQQAMLMAFSPELVADLTAAFPESAGWLENHGSWQG